MFRSLRMKIVFILTLLIVAVMTVVGTFLISSVSNFYDSDFKRQIGEIFANPEFNVSLRDAVGGEEAPGRLASLMMAYSGILGVDSYRDFFVLDMDGTALYGSNMNADIPNDSSNIISAMRGRVGEETRSPQYYDYAFPVSGNGGSYILYVVDSKEELREMTWILMAIIIQAVLFGLIIAVFLSFFLSKAITNPIENITTGAKLIASGEFDQPLEINSRDEIGTLTRAFNSMAGDLSRSMSEVERERIKLETIFLYLTDGVIAFTDKGRLLHINNTALELTGLVAGDITDFSSFVKKCRLDVSAERISSLLESQTLSSELRINGKDLELQIARFHPEGAASGLLSGGVIIVMHNVTERKALEDSRKEFVANVSHELRTPLTSIKSYAETMLETPYIEENILQKFLSVIVNESDRMTRIVKDLLVLSRLENNKTEWRFTSFNMERLLTETCGSLEIDAGNNGHSLVLECESPLGDVVGDEERLGQVIINIVANAIKYTQQGGEISIRACRAGDAICIDVKDNGIGIPKEDLPHIFERFYRVDKARSREHGGTGLGLAIAKDIIDAHRGRIEIASEPGSGTMVSITVPCGRIEDSDIE